MSRRAAFVVLAAVVASVIGLGAAGALPTFPTTRVNTDPYIDEIGYHGSAEEPSIASAKNPLRAAIPSRPSLVNRSTILAAYQVGRVYDGGASGIGYNISVDGGVTWNHGEIPLTVGAGQATTPAGPLTRGSDIVLAYDQKHDVWLASTLGLAGNANVPAVYVNRGIVNFSTMDIEWGPPIVTHLTAPTADSPDKNWITCDNWVSSKGYGNCYEEYDNNGNGNRILMQVSSDGGQTWTATANTPPNGNTGDVTGETPLAAAANAGDTNIKVASVAQLGSTLAAAASAGDTNIKVASVTGFVAGQSINVDVGAGLETRTIATVGTAGATGTGLTLSAALASAHASGSPANDATIKVDIDPSGGNEETLGVASVGTAGAAGTGVTLSTALVRAHVAGANVANSAAPQAGRTGGIGGVPLVQPPAAGSAPGTVCGRVVVPIQVNGLSYFSSSDCGAHWSSSTQILPNMTTTHTVAQGLRTSLLPSSSMDGAGAIYLTWQTRSFRVGSVASTPNDIAMAVMPAPSAANPNPAFGAPTRVPIEADNTTANTADHFIPGISADTATSGPTAHLGLYFYNYPVAACVYADPGTTNQCNLRVGYVSSTDGGQTWSAPNYVASMTLAEVVRTSQGPMVGDYSNATVIPSGPYAGNSISTFSVGLAPRSPNDNGMAQNMYVTTHGLEIGGGAAAATLATSQQASTAQQQFDADGVNGLGPDALPSVP